MVVIAPQFNTFIDAVASLRGNRPGARETLVVLSRHGQTVFNVEHRLQAWVPDADRLTPQGERQAQRLRDALMVMGIEWGASSDQDRAVQTIARALPEQPADRLACLREYDFGLLGGLTWKGKEGAKSEFEERYPAEYRVFNADRLSFTAPGGEGYSDFSIRVLTGFEYDLLARAQGKTVLAVSHVAPIREVLLRTVLGANINECKPQIDGASITMVLFRADGSPDLLLFNNTEHLGMRIKKWDPKWDPSVRPHVAKKVLIVNDEPHKVKDQGDFFVSHSPAAEVVYMDGGERGFIETVLRGNFDLILMDGDLTVAQGVLLIRELRQKGFQGFIAAGSSSEKENRAMRDNGADFTVGRDVGRLAEHF